MEVTDVNAASSAETVSEPTVSTLTPEQYNTWRQDGSLPKAETAKADPPPATEDSSAADASAEDGESAEVETRTAPEAESTQVKPKRGDAQTRIKELLARTKQLESELQQARTTKETPKAESSPVKSEPQNYQEWRKAFSANKWVDEWAKSNPEATYEEAIAAMNDHLDEVRSSFRTREQQTQEQIKALKDKLEQTRKRYEDADTVIFPAGQQIMSDDKISPVVKTLINDSPVMTDLLYVMASDSAEFENFLNLARTDPGKAIRKAVVLEKMVMDELEGKSSSETSEERKTPVRNEHTGQFEKAAPAKKVSAAPPPPKEVNSKGTAPVDEVEAAMNGDFDAYRETMNRRELAARKGK